MAGFRISIKVFIAIIVFIIIMGGVIFHEVPFGMKDINDVYRENAGKIWVITLVATTVFSVLTYAAIMTFDLLKACTETSNKKSDIIKAQSDQIIAMLEYNAKRHDQLMDEINTNTKNDIETLKRVQNNESRISENTKRIDEIERIIKKK